MSSFDLSKINSGDIFLLIWVLYYLQGILYPVGSIISVGLLGINLLISAFCAVKVLQMSNTPIYFRGLNLLILLFSIYGFLHIVSPVETEYAFGLLNQRPRILYIKSIYLSLLPIYAFYYFSRKGYINTERLKVWGWILLVSVTLSFLRNQQEALLRTSRDETQNNAGYLFLSCIPLLVIYRKSPLIQYGFLAYIITFIVMGMKRGAILIGAILAIYFMYKAIKNASHRNKLILVLLSVLLVIGAVYFFLYRMTTSEYMMQRIQATIEGNSSGRDVMYSFFWNYFTREANLFHFIFGRGADGTFELYANCAHNDWLEIAVNQGIVGILLYLIYWKYFYKTWKYSTNTDAKTILALSLLIYFTQTLFSFSYNDMSYVGTCVLGYALANRNYPNSA